MIFSIYWNMAKGKPDIGQKIQIGALSFEIEAIIDPMFYSEDFPQSYILSIRSMS